MKKKILTENQLNSLIYRMVRESLETIPNSYNFEDDSEENSEKENSPKIRRIKNTVEKQLKQPGIDIAPYAYKLNDLTLDPNNGDDNEHKNARSKLYKQINNKPDSNGNPQSLSSKDAIKLYNMLSGGLNENRKGKVLMNEVQFTNLINGLVNESVRRIMQRRQLREEYGFGEEFPEEYYACSETNYDKGTIDVWVGDKEDAEKCFNCSEGDYDGPYETYEEADAAVEQQLIDLQSQSDVYTPRRIDNNY